MYGLGTIINTAAVAAGSAIGIFAKKGLKQRFQDILMAGCGISVMFIGASGALCGMFSVEGSKISSSGSMLLIGSMVLGSLLGELINIEDKMEHLGEKMKKLFHAQGDSRFVDGFVNTSLVICVGAMAIVGSIQDGLTGDFSMLLVKAVLDFVIVLVFASTYGIGTMCSAIAIFVYQGAITLIAHFAGNFAGEDLVQNLSYIGSVLIFCVGVNLAFGKKLKVGNMLPSLLGPVVYDLYLLLPFAK